jgi:hypothetical protein
MPPPAMAIASAGWAIAIGPAVLAVTFTTAVPAAPHPHLPADHRNPFAYGGELVLAMAFLFVGGRLVARRFFRI